LELNKKNSESRTSLKAESVNKQEKKKIINDEDSSFNDKSVKAAAVKKKKKTKTPKGIAKEELILEGTCQTTVETNHAENEEESAKFKPKKLFTRSLPKTLFIFLA